jgi:hypothetical protein
MLLPDDMPGESAATSASWSNDGLSCVDLLMAELSSVASQACDV